MCRNLKPKDCEEIHAKHDAIEMLKLIKNINYKFEDQKVCTFENVITALRGMANIAKTTDEDLMKHRDWFNNKASLFKQFGDASKTEAIANADPRIKQKWDFHIEKTDSNKKNTLCNEIIKLG